MTQPRTRTKLAPRVAIFRDHLGMGSETFIYAQAGALERFVPYFLGSKIAGALPVGDRVHTIHDAGTLGDFREAGFKFARFSPSLDRYLRGLRPSLLHAHFGPDGAVIGPFAVRNAIPLVVTFHGADATLKPEFDHLASRTVRIYRRRQKWLQDRASLFIAVSDFIRGSLERRGFPPERIVRHYIGIDLDFFHARPSASRAPTVLFVGRLTEKKGCAYLIDAMAAVQDARPDVNVTIIGDGPLRPSLEARAEQKRVRVAFLGFQPPPVVREYMQSASVFCVPSITAESGDAEGFGMVFAEASALGTPVASFASGGIPEVVAHGETGLLAPEKDVATLARNLVTILEDAELRHRMSVAAVARARHLFDLRAQTNSLENLYLQVAGLA